MMLLPLDGEKSQDSYDNINSKANRTCYCAGTTDTVWIRVVDSSFETAFTKILEILLISE